MSKYIDLIGAPFKNNGRGSDGYDCYGLAKEIYRRYGVELPEYTSGYKDIRRINAIVNGAKLKPIWVECKPDNLPVPCIVVLRFNCTPGMSNHIGVYIGNGYFIHTREKIGACKERINSPMWAKQIVGFYQYTGGGAIGNVSNN